MKNKVLIIEDDINIQSALSAKLRVLGYEIFVHNGTGTENGLKLQVFKDRPDYLILDLILPELDGFSVLSSFKADDFTRSLPLFVFSDASETDIKTRCLNLGADYFFHKHEFNADDFIKKFDKIVKNLG